MDFVIDTTGSLTHEDFQKPTNKINKDNDIVKKLIDKYKNSLDDTTPESTFEITKEKPKSNIVKFYDEMGWTNEKPKKGNSEDNRYNIEEILKKSVITPEFEKLHTVPPIEISEKKLKEQRKKEREKTKGKKWFGLPATEMTEEIKTDLEILKMRSVLDPKHFYKKNDINMLPKYFQIGKVLDSPLDHYNNRLTKKERKRTLIDELLADAEFTKYNKRKYKEIIQEKQKTHYKAYRQAKKLKRKNKK